MLSKKEIAQLKKGTEKLDTKEVRLAVLQEKFALLKKLYDDAKPAPQAYLNKISKAAEKILTVEQQQQTRRFKLKELLIPEE